jgi:paraquat-inducible protein B
MSLKPSPAVVGAFVLGAISLGAAALLSFGGRNPFAPRHRLVVYFDESVAGLERGAAVKLRGVQSGRVVSMVPTLGPDSRAAVVAVICEMSGNELARAGGGSVELSDAASLKTLVDQGLRARLKPAGLSGASTVDLDFYDPRRYPLQPVPAWTEGARSYPSVPAIPSVAGELIDDLQAVMHQLRKQDFEGLVRNLGGAAVSVQDLSGAEAKKTLKQIGDAAVSVKELADYLERNPNSIISGKKPPAKP